MAAVLPWTCPTNYCYHEYSGVTAISARLPLFTNFRISPVKRGWCAGARGVRRIRRRPIRPCAGMNNGWRRYRCVLQPWIGWHGGMHQSHVSCDQQTTNTILLDAKERTTRTLDDMDTLIHWQWVAWMVLSGSVSAPTSEEFVRRSRRPASSLRGGSWSRSSNAGNNLRQTTNTVSNEETP